MKTKFSLKHGKIKKIKKAEWSLADVKHLLLRNFPSENLVLPIPFVSILDSILRSIVLNVYELTKTALPIGHIPFSTKCH